MQNKLEVKVLGMQEFIEKIKAITEATKLGKHYEENTNSCVGEQGPELINLTNPRQGCADAKPQQEVKPKSNPDYVDKGFYDSVNKPKHYMLFPEKGIEVRDLMKVLASDMEYTGYSCMFVSDYVQMMQYLLRFYKKNGLEDLEKAKFYLDKLIQGEKEECDNELKQFFS